MAKMAKMEWIDVHEQQPYRSMYYMCVVERPQPTGGYCYRSMEWLYYKGFDGWKVNNAVVTHWLDFPKMPPYPSRPAKPEPEESIEDIARRLCGGRECDQCPIGSNVNDCVCPYILARDHQFVALRKWAQDNPPKERV